MTELELYKFIHENEIEWHREQNDGESDIIIFPSIFQIEEFNKLVSDTFEQGIECVMRDGYFAFWMRDICEYYGIDINKVFISTP